MRSHVTGFVVHDDTINARGFNTASGMRSHVTKSDFFLEDEPQTFQYRKRYEITCDSSSYDSPSYGNLPFQYRKRYEITCDARGL